MEHQNLYDLLKQLSEGGRNIAAQQQGLSDHENTHGLEVPLLPDHADVAKSFAQTTADHGSAWQGMPQAGISLTYVARCVVLTNWSQSFNAYSDQLWDAECSMST